MDLPNVCSYCESIIDSDDFLNCELCKANVHIKCLKRPSTPGDLLGDVFFDFTCIKCSKSGKEIFKRQKLPWLMIIVLAIYNLSIQSKGLSHHGFFHWRTHIVNFIDKNRLVLFETHSKRKKVWTGTVSGTLSHHSPDIFLSGQEGWWKLTYNQTPKFYLKLYEQLSQKRQQLRNDKKNIEEAGCSSDFSNEEQTKRKKKESEEEEFSRTLPYMGRSPKIIKKELKENSFESESMSNVQSSLMDFLESDLENNHNLLHDIPNITSTDFLPLMSPYAAEDVLDPWTDSIPSLIHDFDIKDDNTNSNDFDDIVSNLNNKNLYEDDESLGDKYRPKIVQVTNFQQSEKAEELNVKTEVLSILENESDSADDNSSNDFTCHKSLFTIGPKRELPWLVAEPSGDNAETQKQVNDDVCSRIEIMSEYEEKDLLKQLQSIISYEAEHELVIPAWIRRLYRKLCIRNIKRNSSISLMDVDSWGGFGRRKCKSKPQLLDRYHYLVTNSALSKSCSFQARIVGSAHYEVFESPHTSRVLHPFIFRDSKCFPAWVKLMCELQYTINGEIPSRSTIDFCYVRPYHIAAVNALLQRMFWPGIDMSECLSYPEFSVVALYKKIVVGCAFLVPDVSYNEAYISFMAVRPGWRRCGIANFMLYHLTQTCMGKDITLHVSATNPAICLYQKFGFKIEEVILDFYDKYLPIDATQSRHAFFLRMTR